jgi:alkylation response protein AidB-like acyl-CoA dehydrogenase
MDLSFSPEEEAFRKEVRQFLDENLPDPVPEDDPEFIREWNAKVRKKGWVGFSWPKEAGGGGGTLIEQFILKEEMSKRNAPSLGSDFMGLTWVGPAIIRHGTEDQRRRFIADILDSKSLWCTGYSEPDSGSDLASLKCKAVCKGDFYVINGQKIWTSAATEATWIYMMVRTDPGAESKYQGITCLLLPMDTPGIEIRPIDNLSGKASFAEVFFTDVRVPLENRLGAEGEGWMVTMGALANERSGISEATVMAQALEDLKNLARQSRKNGKPALQDVSVRRRLAAFESRIEAMRLTSLRHLTHQIRGQLPSSETSINKLQRGFLEFGMSELSLELLGSASQYQGRWQNGSLSLHGTVIGGGTPNIQRNIIAQRILRLPKD